MARGVGIHVLAVQPGRAECQDARGGGDNVLDHDVEVELLRDSRVGPGRRPVIGSSLECQARRLAVGGDYHPVVASVGNWLAQQPGVERGEHRRVGAVQDHMMQPSGHGTDGARSLRSRA
jgi:hypothetical protein